MPRLLYKCLSSLGLTVGCALVFVGCAPGIEVVQPAQARHCQLPDHDVLASIVRVTAGSSDASSGVVVGKNSVLTVAHAIPEGLAVSIKVNDQVRSAVPVAVSEELDLALLEVDTDQIPTLEISDTALKTNEHVWAVGFPLAGDQRTSLGVFQQHSGESVITSAHISSGTSGGGLLRCREEKFELAGIVRAYLAYQIAGDVINSGDSVAVSADTVKQFIDRAVRYTDRHSSNRTAGEKLAIKSSYTASQ